MLGSPAAGAEVFLRRELAGQSSFQQMAQTVTDSAGHYTFTMSPMTNQAWYVTSNGIRSTTLDQQVHALVGLSTGVHLSAAGQPILLLLHGRVTPSHAGEAVLIERRTAGAWHVIARPRLGNRSTYASSLHFPSTGTVQLRTVLRGDARNVRSISRSVTVTANP
jgi:hypothetical protein